MNVFDKIIAGEIPCYKIYEDNKVLAFLDINPETKGHTLVIPKIDIDKVYEMEDEDFTYLMLTAKKISKHMEKILNTRIVWKIVGTDVPHAHIHLMPMDPNYRFGRVLKFTDQEMAEIQKSLAF